MRASQKTMEWIEAGDDVFLLRMWAGFLWRRVFGNTNSKFIVQLGNSARYTILDGLMGQCYTLLPYPVRVLMRSW